VKQVAILGAGMVSKPLVDYLMDRAGYRVLMATRTVAKAEAIIAERPNGRALAWTADNLGVLEGIVGEADLVVSMIPPSLHVPVAEACLRNGKPLVTTSYISQEMQALDEQAKQNGVLLLNEIGEDPGIDHMGAKRMIDEVVRKGGRVRSLASYGAGLPSFESNRNPMGYKFSWSPRGVMLAAQTAAAYVKNGEVVEVPAAELFDHHWLVDIEGLGTFETYPNRSSLRYLRHFGLDEQASLYRGLLRFVGWCSTMKSLIALNLLDSRKKRDFAGLSYREFTASSIGKPGGGREDMADFLGLSIKSDTMERLGWLGLFDESPRVAVLPHGPFVTLDVPHGPFLLPVVARVSRRRSKVQDLIVLQQRRDPRGVEDRVTIVLQHKGRTVHDERLLQVPPHIPGGGRSISKIPVQLPPRVFILNHQKLLFAAPLPEPCSVLAPHHTRCGHLVADSRGPFFVLFPQIGDHRRNCPRAPVTQVLPAAPSSQHLGAPLAEVGCVTFPDPGCGPRADHTPAAPTVARRRGLLPLHPPIQGTTADAKRFSHHRLGPSFAPALGDQSQSCSTGSAADLVFFRRGVSVPGPLSAAGPEALGPPRSSVSGA